MTDCNKLSNTEIIVQKWFVDFAFLIDEVSNMSVCLLVKRKEKRLHSPALASVEITRQFVVNVSTINMEEEEKNVFSC